MVPQIAGFAMPVWTKHEASRFSMKQLLLRLAPILFVFAIFGIFSPVSAQGGIDLSNLDDQTRKQVKAACYFHKLQSEAAYSECLKEEASKRNKSVGWAAAPSSGTSSGLPTVRWKENAQNKSASWGERPSASKLFKEVERSVYIILAAASADNLRAGEDVSQGSAVAISESLVLTNCHVIEDAKAIVLVSADTHYPATLRATGKVEDSCVLEVGVGLSPISALRRYKSLKIGETVYSIGSPVGLSNTLGEGIVSGLRIHEATHYVQTSAPISSGSSGGGLFDAAGNLVGITTFHLKNTQNLNFAISAEEFWK